MIGSNCVGLVLFSCGVVSCTEQEHGGVVPVRFLKVPVFGASGQWCGQVLASATWTSFRPVGTVLRVSACEHAKCHSGKPEQRTGKRILRAMVAAVSEFQSILKSFEFEPPLVVKLFRSLVCLRSVCQLRF